MALLPDQLAIVRTWVGATEPDDATLHADHDRLGGMVGVVRATWRRRLTELLADSLKFSVGSQYSEDASPNARMIRDILNQLNGLADDSDDLPLGGPGSTAPIRIQVLERTDHR